MSFPNWKDAREDGASLPEDFVSRVLHKPPVTPRDHLRASLLRQIRQKREEIEMLEAGLRELDVLERVS